ncbi:uroporphyrinogen-III C-methyltransferase [Enterobacteriaceae bacterium YMB-R22]|jgi:uroporphyrin-3 C-methyltransferase|uniref:uroporphyrinogen-III C-methyltransferase n=1 Tax=Tenebrionicola larvae TaxID=2815733 RepID=UPI00201133F0|nr:uroporphyrinogen-III C-methyltransferase [Tenebrionicola larvae]MBV4414167.1 uroporphyrinogen-III C-methyltransferase [Tenebrionicola larvae]
MTEPKESSAMPEETPATVETVSQPVSTEPAVKKNRGGAASITLSVIAIAIALVAGAGAYTWGKKQNESQQTESKALITRLSALQQQQNQQNSALEALVKEQAARLNDAQARQAAMAKALEETREKIAAISSNDAKSWQLAQADFLVKLAGRKLWSDRDVTTAVALLKSADESLAQLNDPGLINVRRTLTADISGLAGIAQVDFDGIILKLNQLSNQVDDLRLSDNDDDAAPMDADSPEVSGSLKEWRKNLTKSWRNFMENFITVRRRDTSDVPLLAPNQDIYLRENIRSRLLIAAQAVPRHQSETYKQSIDTVATWVRAYYDTNDANTKAYLDDLDNLSQQSIEMDLPDSLKSQPVLEQLMRNRMHATAAPQPAQPSTEPQPAQPKAAPQGE